MLLLLVQQQGGICRDLLLPLLLLVAALLSRAWHSAQVRRSGLTTEGFCCIAVMLNSSTYIFGAVRTRLLDISTAKDALDCTDCVGSIV